MAAALLVAAPAAYAAGTNAGTVIVNTAQATYTDTSGTTVTVPSNTANVRVDEILNVTVAKADPGDVAVQPGATQPAAELHCHQYRERG